MKKTVSNPIQLAALMGETFSIDWLLELSGLRATELLFILKKAISDNEVFENKPGFFQFTKPERVEALLSQFSSEEKSAYTQKIIRLLLNQKNKHIDDIYLLSKFLIQIQNEIEGCRLLVNAGERYFNTSDYDNAIKCFHKAIEDLKHIGGQDADQLFIHAVCRYHTHWMVLQNSQWSLEVISDALEMSQNIEDTPHTALLHMFYAGTLWHCGEHTATRYHLSQGLSLIGKIDDQDTVQQIYSLYSLFCYAAGDFKNSVKAYEKSLQCVENLPHYLTYASCTAAYSYAAVGQINQGLGLLDTICAKSSKHNQDEVFRFASFNMGLTLLNIGRVKDSSIILSKLESAFPKKNFAREEALILIWKAIISYHSGTIEKVVSTLKNYINLIQISNQPMIPNVGFDILSQLCWAIEEGEIPSISGLSIKAIIRAAILNPNFHQKGIAYRYQALLQYKKGASDAEILESLEASVKYLNISSHQLELAQTRIELARFQLSKKLIREAETEACMAFEVFAAHNLQSFPEELSFLIKGYDQRNTIFENILTLIEDVSSIKESHDIEQKIILTAVKLTGAERGAVFLPGPDKAMVEFKMRASINMLSEDVLHPDFSNSLSLIRQVFTDGKSRIADLEISDPEYNPIRSARSCICTPMRLKNRIIGILYLDNRILTSLFKKEQLRLLSFFATQSAIAIENTEAFNQIKQISKKLEIEKQFYQEQHLERTYSGDIIGESKGIREVLNKINLVANSDTTVLILGETGVGKELVAGTILKYSSRFEKPFVAVNCCAFPEGLIAAELFGHEKGAFTGAHQQKAGRFELADGGTLFLDEIGDIPLEVQVRLLRILQTREYERVGGSSTLSSNFRLITATNRNLPELVEAGKFREDLFYRLNVFPIIIPPLRQRKEDIPLLAHFFLKKYARKLEKSYSKIRKVDMDNLVKYKWPGNVRELENVIERGVIMSTGKYFRVPELKNNKVKSQTYRYEGLSMKEVKSKHIIWALDKTHWKISGPGGAAELLDMHYSTLRFHIKKLGIEKNKMSK